MSSGLEDSSEVHLAFLWFMEKERGVIPPSGSGAKSTLGQDTIFSLKYLVTLRGLPQAGNDL